MWWLFLSVQALAFFFNVFVLLLKNSSGNNIVDVINDVISISFSF